MRERRALATPGPMQPTDRHDGERCGLREGEAMFAFSILTTAMVLLWMVCTWMSQSMHVFGMVGYYLTRIYETKSSGALGAL